MKKVLLLNPPWEEQYIRDKYCSSTSKANYLWYPTDLVVQSGVLRDHCSLFLIDAVAEKMDVGRTIHRILHDISPDIILSLIGSKSYIQDLGLLRTLKIKLPAMKIFLSGGVATFNGPFFMDRYPFIDGVLYDYTGGDIKFYLNADYQNIDNMIYRRNGRIIEKGPNRKEKTFSIGLPDHGLFKKECYSFPSTTLKNYSPVVTSFGCPFSCNFCVYCDLGYKTRNMDEIVEELKTIRNNGISEIFFADPTFGAHRSFYKKLMERMIHEIPPMVWSCNSRVDVTDIELLSLMKKAGCHCIFYGVESGDNQILKLQNKQFTVEEIKRAFRNCDKLGIRTAGFFIFGLPGETTDTMEKTIQLAKQLNCYIASFNIATPLDGSRLHTKLRAEGMLKKNTPEMMDITENNNLNVCDLPPEIIEKYRRKAYREFYFRPHYIMNRLFKMRTFRELRNMCVQGRPLSKFLFK